MLAGALALALSLAACGSDGGDGGSDATSTTTTTTAADVTGATEPAPAPITADALDGRTFTSTEVTGHELVAGSTITLSFDGDQLGASAGCNQLGSTFEIDGATLSWTGTPRATMMACDEALMAQDTWLTELLTGGVEATLSGDDLTLSSDEVTVALTAESDEPAPLIGTAWELESLLANEAVSSLPADTSTPTLALDGDATAAVFTGCNSGTAGVTVDEDAGTLTFEPLALTKAACPGEAASELEATITLILDGETTYEIQGDQLTITKGDEGLIYRAG